jgi:hypothetical protein
MSSTTLTCSSMRGAWWLASAGAGGPMDSRPHSAPTRTSGGVQPDLIQDTAKRIEMPAGSPQGNRQPGTSEPAQLGPVLPIVPAETRRPLSRTQARAREWRRGEDPESETSGPDRACRTHNIEIPHPANPNVLMSRLGSRGETRKSLAIQTQNAQALSLFFSSGRVRSRAGPARLLQAQTAPCK